MGTTATPTFPLGVDQSTATLTSQGWKALKPVQVGGNRNDGVLYGWQWVNVAGVPVEPFSMTGYTTQEQARQALAAFQGSTMPTQQVQLTPQQQNAQAIAGGATQILNTVTQQLNSPPITALSTSAAQALPATPWGALPAQGAQPLAVINPNQFQYPVVYAQPFYKNVWLMAGVSVGLLAVGFTLFKLRPKRR